MRIFRAIVQALVLAVFHFQPETPTCRAVRPELVCDQNPRGARLLANEFAQEPLGGQFVAAALDQSIENETILIDSPRKPVFRPLIVMATSSRYHLSPNCGARRRIFPAKSRPNRSAQRRTVSWLTTMPLAASRSSTIRRLSGNRKYSQTARSMTSAGNRRPR